MKHHIVTKKIQVQFLAQLQTSHVTLSKSNLPYVSVVIYLLTGIIFGYIRAVQITVHMQLAGPHSHLTHTAEGSIPEAQPHSMSMALCMAPWPQRSWTALGYSTRMDEEDTFYCLREMFRCYNGKNHISI